MKTKSNRYTQAESSLLSSRVFSASFKVLKIVLSYISASQSWFLNRMC